MAGFFSYNHKHFMPESESTFLCPSTLLERKVLYLEKKKEYESYVFLVSKSETFIGTK